MPKSNFKVVYVAGNGHSGSTLLDIMLGNGEHCFSVGELSFIVRRGLDQEYCSCESKIAECDFWSKVFEFWLKNSPISFAQYSLQRHKYERNAVFLRTWFNLFFPSNDFKNYKSATAALFEAIHHVSGAKVIIDSSKSPQRIAVLKGILDLQVIHLCREFKGVLNSAKHAMKMDITKGIEADSHSRRTHKTLIDWLVTNVLCELFVVGVNSKKLKYKDYIKNPECFKDFDAAFENVYQKRAFSTAHMLAGNHIRLSKGIVIDKNLGFTYKRLSKRQLRLAKWVDRLFWFWH